MHNQKLILLTHVSTQSVNDSFPPRPVVGIIDGPG